MVTFILIANMFLSPVSSFQDVKIEIFGKQFPFPKAIYNQIQPANLNDYPEIATLSVHMPFLYPGVSAAQGLPFRTSDTYQRLFSGENIQALAEKREHLFFVFKNGDGTVKGYVHGSLYTGKNIATIDELVVDPAFRKQGIAKVLMGRLMFEFSQRGKHAVDVLANDSLSEVLARPYGIKPKKEGFSVPLVMDHLLSRFSLAYLMKSPYKRRARYAEVAEELEKVIGVIKRRDMISTAKAMRYLNKLSRKMEEAYQEKLRASGENFYFGIQDDKIDIANVNFARFVISAMAKKDKDPKDRAFYEHRLKYLETTASDLREAQRQGGLLPTDIQLYIGRLYAFARFLEEDRRGSETDRHWVRRSLSSYLRLVYLKEVDGRPVLLASSRFISLFREILWFRYPYIQARALSEDLLRLREDILNQLKSANGVMTLTEKEELILNRFQRIREAVWAEDGIELEPEFGLLFLYSIEIYGGEHTSFRDVLGRLFTAATFYQNGTLDTVYGLLRSRLKNYGKEKNGIRMELRLTSGELSRLVRILSMINRPLNGKPSFHVKQMIQMVSFPVGTSL